MWYLSGVLQCYENRCCLKNFSRYCLCGAEFLGNFPYPLCIGKKFYIAAD